MKVLITAINSFVGKNIGSYLSSRGHSVYGTARRSSLDEIDIPGIKKIFPFNLNEAFDTSMLDSVDILIHLAHDFVNGSINQNVEGTIKLGRAGQRKGALRQLFISSYSACPDAVTEYGQTKYILEKFFGTIGGICIRPGVVIGQGGIFSKMTKVLNLFPIVPVIDGNKGRVPIIGADQLRRAIERLMTIQHPQPVYNLFNEELVTMKKLIQAIVKSLNRRRCLISLSSKTVIRPLELLDKIGIRLPIDINNVMAFVHNQTTDYPSNLKDLLDGEQPCLAEILQKAIA